MASTAAQPLFVPRASAIEPTGRVLEDGTCSCTDQDSNTPSSFRVDEEDDVETVTFISVGGPSAPDLDFISDRLRDRTEAFRERTGVRVEVLGVGDPGMLYDEMLADANAHVYDGYFFLPVITGEMNDVNGLADITDAIPMNSELDWLDIFPFNREQQAVFDGKVQAIPCDGDQLFLHYRKDVFDLYNVSVPRTWDEYAEVAQFFNGRQVPAADDSNTTKPIMGSCLERSPDCSSSYFYVFNFLVHASTAQSQGTSSSVLFDTETFEPIMGEAMAETLRHIENQAKGGSRDCKFQTERPILFCTTHFSILFSPVEFNDQCDGPLGAFLAGDCAMTFFWGDAFTNQFRDNSNVGGKVGVSRTPGSRKVYDKVTKKLVPCDEESCPYGVDYPDIGRVNHAPFAAAGGWMGSVANFRSEAQKDVATDFLSFLCGREESLVDVLAGKSDPFRKSHYDVDLWELNGFPRDETTAYLDTVSWQLSNPNLALDPRFPKAASMHAIMYDTVREHLVNTQDQDVTHEQRLATAAKMEEALLEVVIEYDETKSAGSSPFKVAYLKSFNAYVAPKETVGLGRGLVAAIIVGLLLIFGFAAGTVFLIIRNRKILQEQQKAEERAARRRRRRAELLDYDSNDEFSEASFVSDEGRDELEEIRNATKKESQKATMWRWIFLLVFFGSSSAVSSFCYIYVERSGTENAVVMKPIGAAISVGVILAFLGIVGCCYDRAVTSHTEAVARNSANAHAVLTNIFPSQFRDRVVNSTDTQENTGDFSYSSSMGITTVRTQPDTPLADLFVDATVLVSQTILLLGRPDCVKLTESAPIYSLPT